VFRRLLKRAVTFLKRLAAHRSSDKHERTGIVIELAKW